MFNTDAWNYKDVQFIEFYGLRRSGNHAILGWLIKNLSSSDSNIETLISPNPNIGFVSQRCGDVYHINDVFSSWAVNNPKYLAGLIDAYVSIGAKVIILSYEDRECNSGWINVQPQIFSFLKESKKIIAVRDISEIFASRYKSIRDKDLEEIGFNVNVEKVNAWILNILSSFIKIKFEDWLSSREYRDDVCRSLGIYNRDFTEHRSIAGGGSSFEDIPLSNQIKDRVNRIEIPSEWKRFLVEHSVTQARRKMGYLTYNEDAERILVLGDSHTEVFNGYTGKEYIFEQFRCHGATARGSINPNTKTNSLSIFKKGLKSKKAKRVIICLGEVDCGYLIWLKNKETKQPIDELMNESIDNLIKFIETEVYPYYKPEEINIMSVIPQVIEDMTNSKFLNGDRSNVNISIHRRNSLTNKWNDRLEQECKIRNWKFIDINHRIVEDDKVKLEYRFQNLWNHHLFPYTTVNEIIKEL